MERSSAGGGFVTGLIVGAAAGAAIALLYTPRSGRRAMEALRARGVDFDKLRHTALDGQRTRLEHAVGEARRAADRTRADMLRRYQVAKQDTPRAD